MFKLAFWAFGLLGLLAYWLIGLLAFVELFLA